MRSIASMASSCREMRRVRDSKKNWATESSGLVYFEADYDTPHVDAIYAMDTIQGIAAKLVWITPSVKS